MQSCKESVQLFLRMGQTLASAEHCTDLLIKILILVTLTGGNSDRFSEAIGFVFFVADKDTAISHQHGLRIVFLYFVPEGKGFFGQLGVALVHMQLPPITIVIIKNNGTGSVVGHLSTRQSCYQLVVLVEKSRSPQAAGKKAHGHTGKQQRLHPLLPSTS